MIGIFRSWRRQHLVRSPLPAAWQEILQQNAAFLTDLSTQHQQQVLNTVKVLVAEKNWEGCGGLVLEDEHRVTIAAQIARMTVSMPDEYFDEVRSVLIYPSAYLAQSQTGVGSGVVVESPSGRLGEAWYRGPVILSWADCLAAARRQTYGRNVVVHEFAHHFDMRNGRDADGVPPIESPEEAQRWVQTLRRDHQLLGNKCSSGVGSCMDCYGATSPSEFFAVATEVFFEEPEDFREEWPEFYELLQRFYQP